MTIIARVRGHDYQIIRDMWVLPEFMPKIVMPVAPRIHPSMMREASVHAEVRQVEFVHSHFEYDVDPTGVTRIYVYLPWGVKPPAAGVVGLSA